MTPPRQRVLAALSGTLLLGALWLAPFSPLALSRADLRLGQGDSAGAALAYDQVAAWTPIQTVRQRALRRSAGVHAGELNDPRGARQRLMLLLEEPMQSAERAEVHAAIAAQFAQERHHVRAARSWEAAIEAFPDARDAARWHERAARAFWDSGRPAKAQSRWERLAVEHSPWRGRANLGLGELHLASGRVPAALAMFEDVVEHGTEDEQAAARLGVSVCREKLGDLDQAVAAIAEADLPESVLRSRSSALLARQAWIP